MKQITIFLALILGSSFAANADVWMWEDAAGDTHFVDTETPIYTWVDEFGKTHYSDTPGHEDAISVVLVWHSDGSLEDMETKQGVGSDGFAYPGETAADRNQREQAEAYFCQRATEIYDSYVNAPQLYRTTEAGQREYLSKKEAAQTIAEMRASKENLCG